MQSGSSQTAVFRGNCIARPIYVLYYVFVYLKRTDVDIVSSAVTEYDKINQNIMTNLTKIAKSILSLRVSISVFSLAFIDRSFFTGRGS